MYLDFYGLREPPFSITPDPRFVFLSERHRDALAHLLYGIGQGGGGGFVQLTGEVGTGKTTLCRLLLEQLPENARVALVLNPRLSPVELLESICEELRVDLTGRRGSLKSLVDGLNAYLLDAYAQGLRVVLIVDEAQNLSTESLEQIRLLTNLETPTQKLLQIILLGQPELREMVARPELRQLAQRITARYHLTPLDPDETEAYVRHRLAVAGSTRLPFTRLALRRLHQHSGGVPRLINTIADRALTAGYVQDHAQIGEGTVNRAAAEVLASPLSRWRLPQMGWFAGALIALAALVLWQWPRQAAPPPPAPVAAVEPTPPAPPETPVLDASELAQMIQPNAADGPAAWNRLLSLWTLRADEVNAATAARCPPVVAPGVYCLRSSGSLAKLSALRRPVVLRLSDDGRQTWAVLLGISKTRARLAIGGDTVDVTRADLERVWLGEYFALWRAPDYVPPSLRRGDSGAAVEWLRERLNATQEARVDSDGPAYFDAGIEAGVRRLQSAHGLLPDGIVGPETLLALTARDKDGPRLRRRLQ
ncbi:ExeA family protein [Chiayiivirga flava]|uniref:General secretion pathway protein A n=1 Tax=Chiayiivirga flava TaxID=659595 RepID=A0A7W8G254_9GAMM|nr:ExeA family protein [Chiayiivirga flava]MBB5209588.1 general secretion pathway protein A [Chiayiivirga flava]